MYLRTLYQMLPKKSNNDPRKHSCEPSNNHKKKYHKCIEYGDKNLSHLSDL